MTWHCPDPGDRIVQAGPGAPTFDSKVEKQREQHPSRWTLLLSCLSHPGSHGGLLHLLRYSCPHPILLLPLCSRNSSAHVSVSFSPPSLPFVFAFIHLRAASLHRLYRTLHTFLIRHIREDNMQKCANSATSSKNKNVFVCLSGILTTWPRLDSTLYLHNFAHKMAEVALNP